ncbi:MAG: Tetrathionate reductase subunit precursor [Verrucomicrobiota bacterium]|jgi:molybdopterin-containing oxidoreductase family iron-sulfur binding subunit
MSKRIFQHPADSETGKRYWRSLGQLRDTPEFRSWMEREFPQGASEFQGGDVSRRNFLQLMGASVALAGLSLSACRRPLKNLVPFTKGVEWSMPGKALFFTSALPARGGGRPLVVTTFDGRPTKIEGNPAHPVSGGSTDVWSQASILDLYDPNRSGSVLKHGKSSSWADFETALQEILADAKSGQGLAFLVDGVSCPSRERLRQLIQSKYPEAKWASFEPNGNDLELKACSIAFGKGTCVVPDLSQADVILTVDRDLLGVEGDLDSVRRFAARRRVNTSSDAVSMNRLYVVENRYTLTGGMSDHRLRLASSRSGAFLRALALEVASLLGDKTLEATAACFKDADFKAPESWVKECAADLVSKKGKSLVLVGQRQPAEVQLLGFAVNASLGAMGQTLHVRPHHVALSLTIKELSEHIAKGKTNTLIILGGNPVFNAPSDLKWKDAQSSVRNVIHLSHEVNETSEIAQWHIPGAHFLEQWGDCLASDGSYMVVQPVILPIFNGVSELQLLANIAGVEPDPLKIVQETFFELRNQAPDSMHNWIETLKRGFFPSTPSLGSVYSFNAEAAAKSISDYKYPRSNQGEFELVFLTDSKVDDGRYANNGWLQELPDPVTKLTWDNALLLSPRAAESFNIETGDVVSLSIAERSFELPALILPGHADDSLSVAVGYGRKKTGPVGRGVGFDVYPIVTSESPRFRTGARIRKAGKRYSLAITQEHGSLEGRGADLTRQSTVAEWAKNSESENPDFFKKMGIDAHSPENFSLYSHPPLDDIHAWGMTVDLNTCTGCSACMVACQAENNIPIVGKEQVVIGREMHWIRTDRYFASDPGGEAEPEMVSQPMMCQHCENAPCETVCPVNATVHSEDGLNVMAYNRCIGTRYCANNCPFKVRRFNFFDYNERSIASLYKWNLISEKGMPESVKLQKNPNVTVRMRGVMEKCTFCVQRIQEAKIAAKVASRDRQMDKAPRVPADSFTSACAQVCPTESITFGDLNNPDSRIHRNRKDQRGYRLLEYLNTQNRVWYLARIRNPNLRMPDAHRAGSASRESHASNPRGGLSNSH